MIAELTQNFRNLSVSERIRQLFKYFDLTDDQRKLLSESHPPLELAQNLIENTIGYMSLPVGVATHFVIDGRHRLIPMCVEETSIIAAASSAAKWIAVSGGKIQTQALGNLVMSQIHVPFPTDPEESRRRLLDGSDRLLAIANSAVPGLRKRGGGFQSIDVRVLERPDGSGSMLSVDLFCDPCDAMGANMVTQAAEAVRPVVQEITGDATGMAILSNLNDRKCVRAEVEVPTEDGQRFEEASFFAEADAYRAATHNKGIMNAIDAILIATGNDWRAVEAGAHAFASKTGRYQPLATWRFDRGSKVLRGQMTLPLAVGTVGGMTKVHPTASACLKIIEATDAVDLARVCAAVGLVQNLAALRALTGPGLVQGHMKLHAANIAYSVNASPWEFPILKERLAAVLEKKSRITHSDATEILNQIRQEQAALVSSERGS